MKFKLVVTSLCLCLIIVCVIIISILELKSPQHEYPISRQIQYSFTLQNRTNKLIKNAEFRTYAPVKMTPTQLLSELKTSYPYEMITDDKGNQILHFAFENFPPYSTKIITIKAELKLSNIPNKFHTKDLEAYLQDEQYCESRHPEICRIAGELNTQEGITTAENILNWVAGSIHYTGYHSDARGALYALENKKGDCTELMYLFTALCRANRIPARCIAGYICNKNTVISPEAYHNWAEFFEGGTWRIADPQNKIFMKNQGMYIAMRIIDGSRLDEDMQFDRFRYEGKGLKVKMMNS